jgi:D-alanyl-D-alanine carboxypeptidase/D-alanyl-D-alanine-endopeptidase (penicillin-binding protein 4)
MKRPNSDFSGTAFIGTCFPPDGPCRNHKRLFMPASTTKLYTSYLACETLGEDFVFHSEYSVQGSTLYLRALGNPLLSDAAMKPLLEDLHGEAIQEIVFSRDFGGVPRYPATWVISDVREAWGAPLSEVCFRENYVTVDGSTGAVVAPKTRYFSIQTSEGAAKPFVEGRAVFLPKGFSGTFEFPILDPEHFLFEWLRERLGGAAIRKGTGPLQGAPKRFAKAPMKEVLKTMNKKSSNIIAELLLVHSARARHVPLDYEQPLPVYREVLEPLGVRDALLYDGSGVSRYNLVSPAGTVALLEAAKKYRSIFDSLPIGGKDGTLADRKLPQRIHAKTGSLTGVQALAGYDDGEPFAVMINHGPPDEKAMIEAIDRIVTEA